MSKLLRLILITGASVFVLFLGLIFTRNLIDFPVYYAAGQSLISGRTDLYAPDFARGAVMDYRYPPFFLVSFIPLWLLPYSVAAYVWYLLSVGQLAASFMVLRRLIPAGVSQRRVWLISILISAQYLVMILHYGNAHLLATSLAFAGLYLAIKRRHLPAGLLLAIAITIKLTTLFVLPYFLVKKQWRTLALLVVFLGALNVAPSIYFGLRGNATLLADWYRHVIADQQFHEENGPINLSLKGQLRRYFSEVDYERRVDGDTSYPSVNIASHPSSYLDTVWLVISGAAFISALVVIKWKSVAPSRRDVYSGTDVGMREAQVPGQHAGSDAYPGGALEAQVPGQHAGSDAYPGGALEAQVPGQQAGSDAYTGGTLEACVPRQVEALEIAFLICLMLFIGPLTSKIYFIALLWPLVCVASFQSATNASTARVVRIILTLLCAMNLVFPLLPGRSIQRLLLVLGVDFYVNLLLLLAIGMVWFAVRRTPH